MKRPYILHPFFFAVFPTLSVFLTNFTQLYPDALIRPMIVSLAAAGLLVLLFYPIGRKWRRAALAASLVILLFSSYGHIHLFILSRFPISLWKDGNLLLAVWMSVMILGVWALLRLLRKAKKLTVILNTVSAALVLLMLLGLVQNLWLTRGGEKWKETAMLRPLPGPNWDGAKPDIYYIILDSYGGEGALRDFYGMDNQPFLEALRSRGFVIAHESAANYWKTRFSLASSLNYHYLPDIMDVRQEKRWSPLAQQMIANSAVRRFLAEQNYQTVAFATDYNFSDLRSADVYYPSQKPVTKFETILLTGSLGILWVDAYYHIYQRQDVVQHFGNLQQAVSLEGPKFVFAHMNIPHPPFIFGPDGGPAVPSVRADGPGCDLPSTYWRRYTGQLKYANQLALQAIDTIIAQSDTPPVIIIQGDHGPGSYMDVNAVEQSCFRERLPILNAYYMPGREGAAAAIPANISPINTFRVVFNAYFDTRLPMAENRHFAYDESDSSFLEVTGRTGQCPELLPSSCFLAIGE